MELDPSDTPTSGCIPEPSEAAEEGGLALTDPSKKATAKKWAPVQTSTIVRPGGGFRQPTSPSKQPFGFGGFPTASYLDKSQGLNKPVESTLKSPVQMPTTSYLDKGPALNTPGPGIPRGPSSEQFAKQARLRHKKSGILEYTDYSSMEEYVKDGEEMYRPN